MQLQAQLVMALHSWAGSCSRQSLLSPLSAPTVVSALNKAWCVNCFCCSTCNSKLTLK